MAALARAGAESRSLASRLKLAAAVSAEKRDRLLLGPLSAAADAAFLGAHCGVAARCVSVDVIEDRDRDEVAGGVVAPAVITVVDVPAVRYRPVERFPDVPVKQAASARPARLVVAVIVPVIPLAVEFNAWADNLDWHASIVSFLRTSSARTKPRSSR